MAGTFFNYQRISNILSKELDYSGRLQLVLGRDSESEIMIFRMENIDLSSEKLESILLDSGYDSFKKTIPNRLMKIALEVVESDGFVMNSNSIKLRNIVDRR